MKRRYSILILAPVSYAGGTSGLDRSDARIPVDDRTTNYIALVNGFGIPYDVLGIDDLTSMSLITDDTVRYSTVICSCPVTEITAEQEALLTEYSRDDGVSLIVDSFLFSGTSFLAPFGLKDCPDKIRTHRQVITDQKGETLYHSKLYPHSPKGFDIGFKPISRILDQSWSSKKVTLDENVEVLASYNGGHPAITSYCFGQATNYVLNFEPPGILKDGNSIHTLLGKILTEYSNTTSVNIDLCGTACLRLDDPGSCERVYLTGYNPGVVAEKEWAKVIEVLNTHNAHLTVAYVPQWVDDGDNEKGKLSIDGIDVKKREPGKTYKSWTVTFIRQRTNQSYDYTSEYRGIKKGIGEGVMSVISHGLTHVSTNVSSWLDSREKYTRSDWYHEFVESVSGSVPARAVIHDRIGKSSALITEAFGVCPEIIVPAAHQHTTETPYIAREAGFKVFSSDGQYILYNDRIVVNHNIAAFYPVDFAGGISYIRAGYPVIFICHDYDIFRNGAQWLDEQITKLKSAGIIRFLSLSELFSYVMAKIESVVDGADLEVTIDFRDSLSSLPENGVIPIKIGGLVSRLLVNDRDCTTSVERRSGSSYIEISLSEIVESKLRLTAIIVEADVTVQTNNTIT